MFFAFWVIATLIAWGWWLNMGAAFAQSWATIVVSISVWFGFAGLLTAIGLVCFARCNKMQLKWEADDGGLYTVADDDDRFSVVEMEPRQANGHKHKKSKSKPRATISKTEEEALDKLVATSMPAVEEAQVEPQEEPAGEQKPEIEDYIDE
jgi:hypothetical protein